MNFNKNINIKFIHKLYLIFDLNRDKIDYFKKTRIDREKVNE